MYTRPRGTRDYLPPETSVRRRVCEAFRKVFELYGYGEIVTPAFEHLELLEAKAGPDVKEQIYWFEDKAGRKLGLRFELTTSIARVVAANPMVPKPIRFYYIQPVWRYEEPQKGRLREFWQAGVELIGQSGPLADAEVVAVTSRALHAAGLDRIRILLSNRKVVEGMLREEGIRPEHVEEGLRALDKLEKRGVEYVRSELIRLGVPETRVEGLLDLLTARDDSDRAMDEVERRYESELVRQGLRDLAEAVDVLKSCYGLGGEVVVDLSVVRGLAYYTDLVFEAKAVGAEDIGSVAGGGRYDDLIKVVGGPELPATGMSIGVERVIEALRTLGTLPSEDHVPAKALVVPVKIELLKDAVRVAERLREAGVSAIIEYTARSLRSTLEKANKIRIPYVVIVGEREVKSGIFTLKDLKHWREIKADISRIIEILRS